MYIYTFFLPPLFLPSPPPAAARLRYPAFASGVATPSQKTDRCPCSASAVSAAGSASAAQPATHRCTPCALRARPPWGLQTENGIFYCKHTAREAVFLVGLTTKFASVHGRALGSPWGRAGAKRLRGEPPTRAGEVPPQAAERASALFAPLSGASSLPLYAVTKKVTEKARRGTPCGRYG